MTYQVGQRVWVVYDPLIRKQEPGWATVTKVGRRWVYLGFCGFSGRVAVGDVRLDGGASSSPGRVWASQEEHAAWVELSTAWDNLRTTLRHSSRVPEGVTAADVACARELLRV